MDLNTNLELLSNRKDVETVIHDNSNVVIVCGRMGPMCVPVYGIMESLREKHPNIKFYDMLLHLPEANIIKELPECRSFKGLPYTVYFKNGKVAKATSSIQTSKQVKDIIKEVYE